MIAAVLLTLFLGPLSATASDKPETQSIDFNQDIRPILSNHCFACHGPDEADRQADLRLDITGEIDFDEVVRRIESEDVYEVMPPPEAHKPLKPAQVGLLKRWIDRGSVYESHWSFRPIERPATPDIKDPDLRRWAENSIDRFVAARWQASGIGPKLRADRRTLIRRLSLDLTGLPPTPQQVGEFLKDTSGDAYSNLVDRLMARGAYGEHMARYWLDLVRFADTNGMHHDHYREMTPYRDWVIRAMNENLPFDDFVRYQIAGDLYDEPTTDQLIASGFNRLHLIIDVGTALPEESFVKNVIDRVSSVGTAFLGLTYQCAVCHDHKYDPISQRDFYRMSAFFNNFDGEPETGRRGTLEFKRGLQPPYLELPSPEQEVERERIEVVITELQRQIKAAAPGEELKADEVVAEQWKQTQEQLGGRVADAKRQLEELLLEIPATLVMRERGEIRRAHVLIRGEYDNPGEVVDRGTPDFLPPLRMGDDGSSAVPSRMDLANWLVRPDHPLTARVVVNRIWQQFFGVGLSLTSEDFGAQGQPPSHPGLLDHLADEFIRSGWNVKTIVRQIVMSETYRQSSRATVEAYEADPRNRMLARGPRFRLDAEVIRDSVLATCGLLNTDMFGRSVKPPQPPGLWKAVNMPSSYPKLYEADAGEKVYRRSVYTFWKRGMPPPQMSILDAPTRDSCIARRERTNTPLQALLLMNEQEYFKAAGHLAAEVIRRHDLDRLGKLAFAFETITSALPSEAEIARFDDALGGFIAIYESDPGLIAEMNTDEPELAGWTLLIHSMLNLDRTKTKE